MDISKINSVWLIGQPQLADHKEIVSFYTYTNMRYRPSAKVHVQTVDGAILCKFRSNWYDGIPDRLSWDGTTLVWHNNEGRGHLYAPEIRDINLVTCKTCKAKLDILLKEAQAKEQATTTE